MAIERDLDDLEGLAAILQALRLQLNDYAIDECETLSELSVALDIAWVSAVRLRDELSVLATHNSARSAVA